MEPRLESGMNRATPFHWGSTPGFFEVMQDAKRGRVQAGLR